MTAVTIAAIAMPIAPPRQADRRRLEQELHRDALRVAPSALRRPISSCAR
jgi:predicted nuclease with RNAse H fold